MKTEKEENNSKIVFFERLQLFHDFERPEKSSKFNGALNGEKKTPLKSHQSKIHSLLPNHRSVFIHLTLIGVWWWPTYTRQNAYITEACVRVASSLRSVCVCRSCRTMSLQKTVEKLFDELDKDKSGKISCAELKSALQSCSAEPLDDDHVKAFLDKLDSNKDGELSLDDCSGLVLFFVPPFSLPLIHRSIYFAKFHCLIEKSRALSYYYQ
ncbi:hypothetical protein ECG_06303 [Echinococcus granulosus]|uniref:Immunogenic protein n=1 Tax=Echinococcus granulosus TaxID=6210 RepID=A0A068WIK5_ECHGR|nr:hypothetical protein ECG_06303 [Echinococcus granulosus]CDS19600.1 immunogenic protein [Echinococcus granulosus]